MPCFKSLGIYFDDKLEWNRHVNHVESKLISVKFLMNWSKKLLTRDILLNLYYAHFYSHLSYGLFVWGPMLKQRYITRLFKHQKNAIRIITCSRYNAHTDPLFNSCSLLKFKNLISQELSKLGYKLTYNMLPPVMRELFDSKFKPMINRPVTRHFATPNISPHTSISFNKSYLCKTITNWTQLPLALKLKNAYSMFVTNLKKYLLNNV